jgi:hypothetical protein
MLLIKRVYAFKILFNNIMWRGPTDNSLILKYLESNVYVWVEAQIYFVMQRKSMALEVVSLLLTPVCVLCITGFHTPFGVLAIGSLHALPLWLYCLSNNVTSSLFIPAIASWFITAVLVIGRVLCASVEVRTKNIVYLNRAASFCAVSSFVLPTLSSCGRFSLP